MISLKISDLFRTTAEIALKQYEVRLQSVTENEVEIKKEQEKDGFVSDDSDENNSEDDMDSDDSADFAKTKK